MESRLTRSYNQRVADEVVRRLYLYAEDMIKNSGLLDKDRLTFGDVELSDVDTVSMVLDNAANGVLDAMAVVNPRERQRQLTEIRRFARSQERGVA